MVTSAHEATLRVFQEDPEALTPVFESLRLPPQPKSAVRVLIPNPLEIQEVGSSVDMVLKIEPSEVDRFLLAIAFQAQQDPDRPIGWAHGVAYLSTRYDLPVLLLVVCRDRSTASWAAGPFECRVGTWTSQVLCPLVLGPDNVQETITP
jgi:hypothetical protein